MNEKEKLPWGLTQIAPGSIKTLSKDKLEAFDQGTFKNKAKLSKKEQEELRKKQEEEAAKEVLQDFCESFEKSNKSMAKMFVKGSIINPKDDKSAQDKGSIYKPALKLLGKSGFSTPTSSPVAKTVSEAGLNVSLNSAQMESQLKAKKHSQEKKKSNLELFKEELKKIQTERDERHKKKQASKEEVVETKPEAELKTESENLNDQDSSQDSNGKQPVSVEDPTTTNIFISNLSPKTNEQDLMQKFGFYGLLASVKIMWPRTEDEKARNANCGFVAFMNRKDAEAALKELDGLAINSQTLRLSWSKAITLPLQPVYIPPELVEVTIPPPPSGLPFNAQPQDNKKLKQIRKQIRKYKKRSRSSSASGDSSSRSRSSSSSSTSSDEASDDFTRTLEKALVKVVIPTDRKLLGLIHRMIEFVIREGPAFEAMVMAREINNPQFRFLFDNQCPAHSYYRWKLYSIMHGESVSKWRTVPFRMFKNGSYWQPPPLNRYTEGSPDESYEKAKHELELRKRNLCNEKRDKLEEILRNISSERKSISDAMVFCIENAEKAEEIVECIVESLLISETPLNKKVARLYLISDILHNCCAKVANASYYRRGFERYLPEVFEHNSEIWKKIDGKMKSEAFKQKIISCVRAWEDWAIYPNDFLVNLQNKFLGLTRHKDTTVRDKFESTEIKNDSAKTNEDSESDVDGKPLEEEEEEKSSTNKTENKSSSSSRFVSSKWEQVDPDALEKQAVTTSKWDFFDESQADQKNLNSSLKNLTSYGDDEDDEDSDDVDGKPMDDIDGEPMDNDEDIDGKPMDEQENKPKTWLDESSINITDKRKILREIEVQVLKYIDDLENGKIERDKNMTITQQSEIHRSNLLNEAKERYSSDSFASQNRTSQAKPKSRSRSSSSSGSEKNSRKNERKKKRSKSRSPYNKNRSYYSSSSSYSTSHSRKKHRN